jgi:hypothetical protein
LKSIDYSSFNDAASWMKDAKIKLDNFQANNDNPSYIAFEMLAGAKQNNNPDENNEDFDNLLSDNKVEKNYDIIINGEKIIDKLGKVKTSNPNVLNT